MDEVSRLALKGELGSRLGGAEWQARALALITHHPEEILGGREQGGEQAVIAPTHALLLGQGPEGTGWQAGEWGEMQGPVAEYFEAQREKQWVPPPPRRRAPKPHAAAAVADEARAEKEAVVDVCGSAASTRRLVAWGVVPAAYAFGSRARRRQFRNLQVSYGANVVFEGGLDWQVREGEKWVVHGGNGTGKSTLVELITGDNVLGYAQEHLYLFGRRKGSGESVWQIKSQLGLLSTEFHMAYIDYADPSVRTAFRKPEVVTTWEVSSQPQILPPPPPPPTSSHPHLHHHHHQPPPLPAQVVCSGFHDSMGLYSEVSLDQRATALGWVERFGMEDLVSPPPSPTQPVPASATAAAKAGMQNFFHLSHGQQKLVLLCRALAKVGCSTPHTACRARCSSRQTSGPFSPRAPASFSWTSPPTASPATTSSACSTPSRSSPTTRMSPSSMSRTDRTRSRPWGMSTACDSEPARRAVDKCRGRGSFIPHPPRGLPAAVYAVFAISSPDNEETLRHRTGRALRSFVGDPHSRLRAPSLALLVGRRDVSAAAGSVSPAKAQPKPHIRWTRLTRRRPPKEGSEHTGCCL